MIEVSGGRVRPPRLPGRTVTRDSLDIAIDAQLADLYLHAQNCARAFGSFQLAISAGPELERSLMRLMYDLNFREFPWSRTRVWMLDEVVAGEHLPEDSPELRGTRLTETLLACSGIPENQFHILPVPTSPADVTVAVGEYERQLREQLEWREKGHDRLDCCLAGVNSLGRIPTFDAKSPLPHARIDHNFIRGSRLLSVLIPPDVNESLAAFVKGSMRDALPVGGETIWYFPLGE
jgi:hypothetical protein